MKRRLLLIVLAALLLLCLTACDKKPVNTPEADAAPEAVEVTPKTFPAGTVLCGVDISGLSAEAAAAAVAERLDGYVLSMQLGSATFEFNDTTLRMGAGALDYHALLESCYSESGEKLVDDVFSYDLSAIRNLLLVLQENAVPAQNARLSYDPETEAFVLIEDKRGTEFDLDAVLWEAENAVLELKESLILPAEDIFFPAEIAADSAQAQDALAQANAMLNTSLTYVFRPGTYVIGTETLGKEQLKSWLRVGEDGLSLLLDPGPVNDYVSAMYEAYSLSNNTSTFVTSGGEEIEIRVPSPGETVDSDALYNDIVDAVANAESGERNAPYIPEDEEFTADFGGNYVEIDLTKQHLWVYNHGELVVETDVVTGCVNTGHATPGGVYTIKAKETERYLIGPGYKSWVNYWMPFNGGIGLHDADGWRWSYGGGIYLYSGSHGCINMPMSAAAKTYENVSVGTYVILYGGVYGVAPLTQSVSGTSSYTVKVGDPDFKLDAKPYYEIEKMTYTSSDPSVVTVSESGVVTIVGPGKATITVTAVEEQGYTEAKLSVSVTVNTKCSQGDHSWGEGKVTTEPTCNVEGILTYSCADCDATKTEVIPKIPHKPDSGTVTKPATCGTAGERIFCCTVCGNPTKTETIPATGLHTPGDAIVTTEAGCTTPGVRTVSCSVCGAVLSTEEIPATGTHKEDAGTVTTEPTCSADGVMTYRCGDCGIELRTEAIPHLSHIPDAGTVVQAATCTTEGIMAHSCTLCGTALSTTVIPVTGHNYVGGSCSGCGAPDPNAATP